LRGDEGESVGVWVDGWVGGVEVVWEGRGRGGGERWGGLSRVWVGGRDESWVLGWKRSEVQLLREGRGKESELDRLTSSPGKVNLNP